MSLRKYNNCKAFIEANDGAVLSAEPNATHIAFRCKEGHERNITLTSFANFKSGVSRGNVPFCGTCVTQSVTLPTAIEKASRVLADVGHTLVECVSRTQVTYKCGNCKSVSSSTMSNLKKSKGICCHCQNSQTRRDVESVRKELAEHGLELVGPYENNKTVLVRCKCGEEYQTAIQDVRRGRLCNQCAPERRAQTNLQVYGVRNVAHASDFKDKCIRTNQAKRGVNHHMQHKETLDQMKATNMQNFGHAYGINKPSTYETIKRINIQRLGVPYPLQSKAIQAKIEETCMRTLGVRRPLLSEDVRNKCVETIRERYGADQYLYSEEGKRMMMEKYGAESFLHTQAFKEVMMEKYGAEHAMHSEELFKRCMSRLFRYKEYVFPSGRTEQVMGYEGRAIDYLLTEFKETEIQVKGIPTISYEYDGVNRKYYPDLYIPNQNCLIEVKSPWTLCVDLEKNLAKFEATHTSGYKVRVLVISQGGEVIDSQLEFE